MESGVYLAPDDRQMTICEEGRVVLEVKSYDTRRQLLLDIDRRSTDPNSIAIDTIQVRALQGQLNRGFQKSELVTRIVTLPFKQQAVDRLALEKPAQSVGQLDFAARAGPGR